MDTTHCDHSQFHNAWGTDSLGRHINGRCALCGVYLMVVFKRGVGLVVTPVDDPAILVQKSPEKPA